MRHRTFIPVLLLALSLTAPALHAQAASKPAGLAERGSVRSPSMTIACSCPGAPSQVSSVLRFSPIVGFENSLVGIPASHSAEARPG